LKIISAFSHPFILVFFVFFFFSVSFLTAQSESGDDRITALSITGLNRTRLSTAEQPLRKFIGLSADQVNPDDVRAAILATGILEPIEVEIEGQVLAVTVREKWTIFPVPVFMASSDGIMGGLAFFDANAFGLNDSFFIAGIYHSDGWVATAGYFHTSSGGRIPGWNAMAIFSREERFDRNQRNEDLRRFELDAISFGAGLNFPLLKDTDLFSASVQASFNEKILRDSFYTFNSPNEGLRLFGFGGDLSVRKNNWDGYFLSQEMASLRYSYRTTLEGFSYHSIQFRGTWERSLIPGFRMSLRTGLLYEPEAPVLFESSPSAAQVAILPRAFSAKNYAGLSAGLEKYIFQIPVGTLSISAAYQLVYSHGSILGNSVDHGPVGMLTFYLNRLAIPAVGLGAAYNVKENYLQGSFSLGMSF
jgi:hypothetical protein